MKKNQSIALFLTIGILSTPVFAVNPFLKLSNSHHKSLKATNQATENFTNFSGTWVGTCTGDNGDNSVYTMKIENTDTTLTIDGQEYEIGALNSQTISNKFYTFNNQMVFDWNADHSIMQMTLSDVDYSQNETGTADKAFFDGKGSMSLEKDQLIIDMNLFSFDNKQNMVCTYKKQ